MSVPAEAEQGQVQPTVGDERRKSAALGIRILRGRVEAVDGQRLMCQQVEQIASDHLVAACRIAGRKIELVEDEDRGGIQIHHR